MHHLRPCAAMYDLAGEALSIKVDDTLHRLLHLPATPGTSVPWGSIIPEWPLALGDLARGCDAARPVCCWQLESPDGEPVCAVMSLGPAIGLDDGPDVAPDVAPDAVQHDVDERIPGNGNVRQAPDSAGQGRRNLIVQLVRTPEQLPRRSVQAALLRGLSHDFGNALASIMGFAEIARTRPVDDPLLARSLDNVLKGCAQALSLMDRARAMAGRQSPSFQACDLEPLVEAWCGELRAGNGTLGPGIVWHARNKGACGLSSDNVRAGTGCGGPMNAQPPCGPVRPAPMVVRCDPSLLQRAFVAIVDNARDATETGETAGGVHVRLFTDGATARRHAGWCGIAVSDGGAGLSPDDFFRFGDPYRHAGGAREGRGNGVALARGIMRALGGALEVATFPGRGTEVYLLLPPAEGGDWLSPGTGPVGEVAWPEC